MAKRSSGSVKVRITYSDTQSLYVASVTNSERLDLRPYHCKFSEPKSISEAVDSPNSYDAAARAAIAFAGFVGDCEIEMVDKCHRIKVTRG